ncbi:hypothetical protein [Moritella sp. 28]|uniref:hypothetical protein n=1 Tax=Moritella sp. 28 TaxID=2746232 RepID=UPI001BACB624|nr:hypothetical protein [Moritella sp. 28]QUM85123.1 hypothetical protein HWV02_11750 [Moritella sp. 28]
MFIRKIYYFVPNVDDTKYIDFEHRHNGEYTAGILNADFNNEWGTIGDLAKVNILDRNGSKRLAIKNKTITY